MRSRVRLAVPVLLAAVAVLGAACARSTEPLTTVQVVDNSFLPRTLTVTPGTQVVWVWNGQAPHDVVFAGGPSSDVRSGGQFERAFPTAGTYDYLCSIHPGMVGTIVVK